MKHRCAIFTDVGTTNTRVWLVLDGQVLAGAQAQVGVRDTARVGNNRKLRETLKLLIDAAVAEGGAEPTVFVAAGMIGSASGLAEVPHVPAPAGVAQLAAGTRRFAFPDVTPLPILIVPGVRTGALMGDPDSVCDADVMRGEETLCMGLLPIGALSPPAAVLNLGSHWKAIRVDAGGRVVGSATTLSGEMIHAVQSGTILASAVPQGRPAALDEAWVLRGMREQRRSGLARAMFCVRLHELAGGGNAEQRMAFLVGAFIAADLDTVMSCVEAPVLIVGSGAVPAAWRAALARAGVKASVVPEPQAEAALRAGLARVLDTCVYHQLV